MERIMLKNLLTSLCAKSPWKYAVFWKLKHTYQTLLTWEDGYCDYTKQKKSFKAQPNPGHLSEFSKIHSCGDETRVSDRTSTDFSIGFAIGYMSCLQYALGEGVIGKAAFGGDYMWVSFQKSICGESCSPTPELPEEWNLQLTAGIETILLVPLLPHGVLQLGSFDKVDENLSLVSEIKDKFISSVYMRNLPQYVLPDNVLCSPSMPILGMNTNEGNSWCTKVPSEMQFDDLEVISTDRVVHGHIFDYNKPLFQPDPPTDVEHSCESDLSNPSIDPLNASDLVTQYTHIDAQETKSDVLTLSYMDGLDEVIHCSLLYGENDGNEGISGDNSDGCSNIYLHEDVQEEPMTVSDNIHTSPIVVGTIFGFPVDCELLRGFETLFPQDNDDHVSSWDLCEPNDNGHVTPTYLRSNEDLINMFDPSPWEYYGYLDEGNNEDPMEAVVPIFEQTNDLNSCTIISSISSITSLVNNASSTTLSPSERATEEPTPPAHGVMTFFIGVDDIHHSVTPPPSSKSGISMLAEGKKRKKHSHESSEKARKQTSVSKKARSNNGCKSRPKDRQLIQDRLKELRDIVPKGEKCSIDSLLDKAIKHMQFLTNVAEQAEKLKYSGDKELKWFVFILLLPVLDDENGESEVHIKCSRNCNQIVTISPPSLAPLPYEKGKILADESSIEANNQTQSVGLEVQDLKLYPVMVKDLPRPGSLLIEMVCNEEEFFFEITKVLSHLGLTILNSIMETNSGNNASTKFFVEAPRGFSKMEIFFPLMQLLQRRRNIKTTPIMA